MEEDVLLLTQDDLTQKDAFGQGLCNQCPLYARPCLSETGCRLAFFPLYLMTGQIKMGLPRGLTTPQVADGIICHDVSLL